MSNLAVLFDAPILLVQLVMSGILVGAIFALVAYGMALVWGVMNIINIAQGEFVMLGGYVVFYLDRAGIHPLLGIPIAAAVMAVLGASLYPLVIRRLVDRDMVEQNAKKGLEFADIGYVLVSGRIALAATGRELLDNPDVGRLFLGG